MPGVALYTQIAFCWPGWVAADFYHPRVFFGFYEQSSLIDTSYSTLGPMVDYFNYLWFQATANLCYPVQELGFFHPSLTLWVNTDNTTRTYGDRTDLTYPNTPWALPYWYCAIAWKIQGLNPSYRKGWGRVYVPQIAQSCVEGDKLSAAGIVNISVFCDFLTTPQIYAGVTLTPVFRALRYRPLAGQYAGSVFSERLCILRRRVKAIYISPDILTSSSTWPDGSPGG